MHPQDRPSILLIDDSIEEQRQLIDVLRPHYRITMAFDGQQGYQRALSQPPDLILMDVRMPKTDGFTTCRLLKANPITQNIPIIFLSAANTTDNRILGLSIGGVDYISKPIHPDEVLARTRIHLDLAQRAQGLGKPEKQPSSRVIPPEAVMVDAAKQLILQQLDKPLPLTEIARQVGTYRKKLSQAFREHTGLTVYGFIRNARIAHACHLLKSTDMSIQEISEAVGFETPGNFSTAFRDRMEVTPSAYRQSLQNGEHAHAG